MAVQEELGGLGLDARAAVALLKEYGRAAAPGALFSATVAALWSSSGTADAGGLKDVAALLARGESMRVGLSLAQNSFQSVLIAQSLQGVNRCSRTHYLLVFPLQCSI